MLANCGGGSIPGSRRSPGEGNGYPLLHCLGNPIDKGAWQATVHTVAKSQTQLSNKTTTVVLEKTLESMDCKIKSVNAKGNQP